MLDPKKQLSITLTEPVVFLRSSDPSGRLQSDPDDSPTLVRGILTLNVAKPIGISSIEVELTGVVAIIHQEGIGSRRIEYPEKQKIYSSTVTVFRADQVPRGRSSASVGPGLSARNSNEDEHAATISYRPSSLPRGRSERRSAVSVPFDLGPTPPYTVADPPTPVQSRLCAPGDHRAQTLEELRQALRDNIEGQADFSPASSPSHIAYPPPSPTVHSNTSSTSNDFLHRENDDHTDNLVHTSPSSDGDISFQNTTEEPLHILPHGGPSNTPASHSRLRISLTSVLGAVREITSRAPSRSRSVARLEEREHDPTRTGTVAEEQSEVEVGEGVPGPDNGSQPGRIASHLSHSNHTEHREHHLLGLGRVLGFERDHEKEKDGEQKSKEHGESWREFKPGTYSYPISFLLPPSLPPTFSLPYGSLSYIIKGVAHRPGTFTSKLSCQVPLLVVAAPAIGAGEGSGAGDPGPLFVQRQWQEKLAYSFGLSSRLFLLGSERRLEAAASRRVRANTESLVESEVEARAEGVYGAVTLDLTLLPIEKVKIWKLDVIVVQRIRYVDKLGRLLRDDDRRLVRLLEVWDPCTAEVMDLLEEEEKNHKNKHKHKHEIPLLPTPISPHRSPLLRYLSPSTDPSIIAGPGPYPLSTTIGLPGCNGASDNDLLHFTVKHKNSRVKVDHLLRIVIRVESVGDDDTNDHGGERKRLVDIAIQTPIIILSCRCIPEYQTLPEYSQITADSLQDCITCPCHTSIVGPTEQPRGHEASSTSSFESEHAPTDEQRSGHEHSRSPPLHPHPSLPASWTPETTGQGGRSPHHAETHSHAQRHHSWHSQSYSVWTSDVRARSQDPPSLTPHTSRPPSPLARYERLVSGLESEAGEVPPSYESVALGP